ncbi:hypothetical protein, partial [Bradyrhizobium liaoningense]|uniref:hypothetical protein n=1 Tax=Bradyrhizobium liaoningense TaxID=43992 RepID=UPI001AEBDD3B
KSKIEIAGFWAVKPQSPAISNAAASGKQTPNQVLGGLFTDNYSITRSMLFALPVVLESAKPNLKAIEGSKDLADSPQNVAR